MKKTLLIVTTLMALGLPVHAAQIAQADQADQAKVSQQSEPIQTETFWCLITPRGIFCR
ncbi:hypothetical protein [Coleofasciculus sp.]|uniref:hypothetical protein n=1 Tax=Coleofasciculus sp. TaxID=3100458 RepID=UPI003A198542